MDENKSQRGKNTNSLANLRRFGKELPVTPGPGRPPLPEGEKERRKILRDMIQQATPQAIQVLKESLLAHLTKDRIRAAEVLVNHSLPKQEEVETSGNTNHFLALEPKQLPELIRAVDRELVARKRADEASGGPSA